VNPLLKEERKVTNEYTLSLFKEEPFSFCFLSLKKGED
jgi:hypothetical protein